MHRPRSSYKADDLAGHRLTEIIGVSECFIGCFAIEGAVWKAGLNVARSVRAPSIYELFANGPHTETQAFEVGDPDLASERSLGFEASVRHDEGVVSLAATAYLNKFSNFIFQAPAVHI